MIFWLGSFLLLQVARLFFLLRSAASFEGLSFQELTKAFVYGCRFDASALAYLFLAAVGVELALNILRSRSAATWTRSFKVLGVSAFFLISIIDAEYFHITQKRIDASILAIGGDIGDQIRQLLENYSYVVLIFFAVLFLFWHLSGRVKPEKVSRFIFPFRKLFFLVLSVPLAIVLARGGIQEKPIKISSALVLGNPRLITLSLNTPFVVMQTLKKQDELVVYKDFDLKAATQILREERPSSAQVQSILQKDAKANVVLIILESFSKEYSGFTPFLNSLKQQGISFENHFANGRTSIEAIPSLLGGLPSLMSAPYITSRYVNTALNGIPSLQVPEQRDFLFFHGARKGSMYFDSFSTFLGFSNYYGKEDYDGDPAALYDWGVHDHAFLDFSGKMLGARKKPFFASIFTLSSHQPFEIPASFSTTIAEAPTPFARSLRYADYSLQLFFEKYSSQPWFKNTLFILTGDHTSQCKGAEYCSQTGSHRVPLILFHGGKNLGGQEISKITQHADIPPSVADYLSLDASKLLPFGHSILDLSDKGVAQFSSTDEVSAVFSDAYYRLNTESFLRCEMQGIGDASCAPADFEKHAQPLKYLKALRSYFSQSLDLRRFN